MRTMSCLEEKPINLPIIEETLMIGESKLKKFNIDGKEVCIRIHVQDIYWENSIRVEIAQLGKRSFYILQDKENSDEKLLPIDTKQVTRTFDFGDIVINIDR